jgi:hypothetical protein
VKIDHYGAPSHLRTTFGGKHAAFRARAPRRLHKNPRDTPERSTNTQSA